MSGPDFNQIGGFRNHVTTPNSEILCKNERENITPEAHSQSLPALSQPSDLLHFLPLPQVIYCHDLVDMWADEEYRLGDNFSMTFYGYFR